jgi:hypothetical protein
MRGIADGGAASELHALFVTYRYALLPIPVM